MSWVCLVCVIRMRFSDYALSFVSTFTRSHLPKPWSLLAYMHKQWHKVTLWCVRSVIDLCSCITMKPPNVELCFSFCFVLCARTCKRISLCLYLSAYVCMRTSCVRTSCVHAFCACMKRAFMCKRVLLQVFTQCMYEFVR